MKTRNEVKERYRFETKREVNMSLGGDFIYTDEYVEWLENMVVKNCRIANVSARIYPEEYVRLAKPNYLNKDGEIVEAEKADINGNTIYLAHKDDLYVR